MRGSSNEAWVLKETREIEVPAGEADSIQFRIELFEMDRREGEPGPYRFRVFRYDTFRLLPLCFASRDDASACLADHELLVVDTTFDSITVAADSPSQAWDQMWDNIQRQFDGSI